MDLRFSTNRPATISEAREIIVLLALKFVQRINEDKELMKFLANSPASVENISLFLRFAHSDTSPLQSAMVIGIKKLIVYNKFDEQENLINMHRETFEEAEQIVRQSASSNNFIDPSSA